MPYSGKGDLRTFSFVPSLDPRAASQNLSRLIPSSALTEDCAEKTASDIRKLDALYRNYCRYVPPPWASSRLAISNEAVRQSELWLPMEIIAPPLIRFLRSALTFPPTVQGTHLKHGSSSWLEFAATFPAWLESKVNPAKLLNRLLVDYDFRIKFILWLFMPKRYYGTGSNRYPDQMGFLKSWIATELKPDKTHIRILDAASGDGEAVYAYTRLLHDAGFSKDAYNVEGWAFDPLESWSAAHIRFCHNTARESEYRMETEDLFKEGITNNIVFTNRDMLTQRNHAGSSEKFDVILCNGLLFGPLLHDDLQLKEAMSRLRSRLRPGGLFLCADHFHHGWKKRFPSLLRNELLTKLNLLPIHVPEGIAAIKKGDSA